MSDIMFPGVKLGHTKALIGLGPFDEDYELPDL